jgi:hypothetical protein
VDAMLKNGTSVINRCFSNVSDRIAAYRLINNKRLKMEDIVQRIAEDTAKRCGKAGHVLVIQDTSEFLFDGHKGRLSQDDPDLGYGTNRLEENCVFAHPALVVDAESRTPLGFSSVKVFNHDRKENRKKRELRARLPLEEKESCRWAEAATEAAGILPQETRKTIIGDRENDIYEVMVRTLDQKCDFLIRSMHDRALDSEPDRLCSYMAGKPVSFVTKLDLMGHKGRKKRVARLNVTYAQVRLKRPQNLSTGLRETITCWCIRVVEDSSTVPQGEKPTEWRLLTSHDLKNDGDARRCVEWYRCRWYIEELFRVCKSQGFRMESAQLEEGASLKKMIVLTLYTALRCVSLKRAYDEKDEEVPACRMFNDKEVRVLHLEMDKLHSESPRSKDGNNPFREDSLPWAAWIIARLGCWCNYPKAYGNPGYMTLKRGLDCFYRDCDLILFTMDSNFYKDVYKE